MRILHLGKYYHPRRGGMETVLRHLAEGVAARGHDVDLLVAGGGVDGQRTMASPDGGTVRVLRAFTCGEFQSQPLTPTLVGLIRRELACRRPDLVHLHLPNPLAAAAWLLAARLEEILGRRDVPPLAVWHHADITRQRLGRRLAVPLQLACLRRAAGICVSSRSLAENSRELAGLRDKVRVVPFGIPAEPWSRVEPRHDGPFLFVGRLVAYKGLEVLLDAIAQVPGAYLEIVGEGPLGPGLEERAGHLGLGARVAFRGRLEEDELLAAMAGARGFVLPSLDASETFGLAQLEAMAAGLPVVASDLPTGVRDLGVEGETHLFVPPGDVAALAGALGRLQTESGLAARLGEAARRRSAGYGREPMIDELLDCYAMCLGAGGEG